MEYKLMHRSYRPTKGGRAVPGDKLINDLGKDAVDYIGTFSEYNPIGLNSREDLAVHVVKETTQSVNQQKPFKLEGFKVKSGMHLHSDKYNCNSSVAFSKQDLLRIAHAMDDTDRLQVDYVDGAFGHIDVPFFKEQCKKVVGYGKDT